MDTKLSEDKRIQLDQIVKKMVANKESDSNIRFVVDDFKKKYGNTETAISKTQTNLLDKTTNIVNKIFPGKNIGKSIGTLAGAGYVKAKDAITGSNDYQFYDLSAPSIKENIGDVVKGGALIGAASLPVAGSIVGKAAQFGTIGALSGAGEAMMEDETLIDTVKQSAKSAALGAATGAAFGLAGKGVKALGNFLGKAGDKIQMSVIKPSQADIKDGFSIETVKKYNLGGSLKKTLEKTDVTIDKLSKDLNAKLATNKTPVDLNDVYEKTAKRLLGNKLESFGSNSQLEGAIEKLRGEISAISGQNGLVSIPEAQMVKRASGHFGAWQFGIPTPEASASQKVYNTFYNELKRAIEVSSPEGVKSINKQISELIPVMNAVIRRIPVAERNAALSLTDIISLSAGILEPRALSLSLLNLASKSGTVGSVLSKTPNLGQSVSSVISKTEPVARVLTTQ